MFKKVSIFPAHNLMKNIKPVVSVFKKKVNSFVKKSPLIGGPTLSPGKLEIMQYLRMLPYKFYTISKILTHNF